MRTDAQNGIVLRPTANCQPQRASCQRGVYWKHPELVFGRDEFWCRFQLLERIVDSGRFATHLVKCSGCGHLNFYVFHEENYVFDPNEPIDLLLIPVASDEDTRTLRQAKTRPGLLQLAMPRLHHDDDGGNNQKTYWTNCGPGT